MAYKKTPKRHSSTICKKLQVNIINITPAGSCQKCSIKKEHSVYEITALISSIFILGIPFQGLDLGYKVVQAEVMADMDADYLKGIILIDDKIQVHVYPESSSLMLDSSMQMFFHLINPDTGTMTGYRLLASKSNGLYMEQVLSWKTAYFTSKQIREPLIIIAKKTIQ